MINDHCRCPRGGACRDGGPHCEEFSIAGPTEPCGDLSTAPFGGGEPARRCDSCTPERCAGPHHCRNEWDAQRSTREAATRFTGATPGMLQDDCAGLSGALASKPDARQHAREAAQAIRTLPNCAVECEALCQMSTRGYCERPRRVGWSDSGPVEGA